VVISLSIIALVLAAALGIVLVERPSLVRTVTSTDTTTVIPSQEAESMVSEVFALHLLSFTSANVSSIVSQYGGNANVTWIGHGGFCYSGLYAGSGEIMTLLGDFLGKVTPELAMGNVTRTVTAEANGSMVVSSTFDFAARGPNYGIVNGTVSAQELYAYSAANGAWLISQETWDFLTFSSQFAVCPIYG